jgi:5-methylcytosine-specific restriction endonuclease McrA
MERRCKYSECGKTFEARSIIHAFCSEECRKAVRGTEYRKARELAFIRDGWACTDCDADRTLECHHIEPLCLGGDNSIDNLQTLCRKCHRGKHKNWRAAYEESKEVKDSRQGEERETANRRGHDRAA